MPTAWKKTKLGARRLASTLGDRAKRGVGDLPLVVQAGFPTSVADLVVKNRSRLKKTPRWLRPTRSPEGAAEAGCSAVAAPASKIAGSTDAGWLPSSPLEPAEQEDGQLLAVAGAKPRTDAISDGEERQPAPSHVSTSSEARSPEGKDPPERVVPDSSPHFKVLQFGVQQTPHRSKTPIREGPDSSPREEARKSLEGGNRKGPRMTARVLFIVVVLAIVTKKVALGVSASAFTILLLESIGRHLAPFLKPCGESKKKRSSTVAARVSVTDHLRPPDGSSSGKNRGAPIKNATGICNRNLGSFQSGSNSGSKIPVELSAPLVQTPAPASQPKDQVEAEGSRGDQKACPKNRSVKKLLRKLVPKKLSGAKGGGGGKPEPASDSNSKGASGRRGEGEGPSAAEEDVGGLDDGNDDGEEGGRELHGFEILAYNRSVGLDDAAFREEKVDEPTNASSGHLVFFLVVLFGLVGGRLVAMVLTVLCYSLVSSARSFWGSWKMHRRIPDFKYYTG